MFGEHLTDVFARKRVKLLDADQTDVGGAFPQTHFIEGVKDLSRAKGDLVTLTRSLRNDDWSESRPGRQFRELRLTRLFAQERFELPDPAVT